MLDSHCHLNDNTFIDNVNDVIKKSKEAGIATFLVIGWDVESSKKAIEIAEAHDGVYAAVGIHPENLEGVTDNDLDEIRTLAKHPKVLAIGEIGLDYYWYKDADIRENQKLWFKKQIELANELQLPISIHARDAVEDTYEILKKCPPIKKGVLHCYSGPVEMMNKFLSLGLYFGFDGPITYKNAVTPKECVKNCPIDKLLSETDCPYLSPVPYRGQTNDPSHIKEIVAQMAELKELTIDEVEKNIDNNFNILFHGEPI